MERKRTRRLSMQDAISGSLSGSSSHQSSIAQPGIQNTTPTVTPAILPTPQMDSIPVLPTPPMASPPILPTPPSGPTSNAEPSCSAPSTSGSSSKSGRGAAKLPHNWSEPSFKKLSVRLSPSRGLIGEDAKTYSFVCGVFARMANRLPLNYKDWHQIPDRLKDEVWQELQSHSTMPSEGRSLTMKMLDSSWRDYKSHLKKKYFEPKKDSNEPIVCGDKRVDESQWRMLVDYWRLSDVQAKSLQNRKNRAAVVCPPATGRTPLSIIEHQMASQGQSTSQYDMFIATRRWRGRQIDGYTSEMIHQLEAAWQALPKAERTEEAKDRIFHQQFGPDSIYDGQKRRSTNRRFLYEYIRRLLNRHFCMSKYDGSVAAVFTPDCSSVIRSAYCLLYKIQLLELKKGKASYSNGDK